MEVVKILLSTKYFSNMSQFFSANEILIKILINYIYSLDKKDNFLQNLNEYQMSHNFVHNSQVFLIKN